MTVEMNKIDPDSAARLTYLARQRWPLRSDDCTLEKLRSQFELERMELEDHVVTAAYNDKTDELVGLLQIWTRLSGMGVSRPWQPIVNSDRDPDTIAISLIEQSKSLVHSHARSRLEIWMSLDGEGARKMLSTYVRWYKMAGFRPVG